MKKRLLSLLLILCLCAALLPVAVLAEDNVTIVMTEEELKDAIEKGGAIQLGADITLGYNAGFAFLQIKYDDVTLDLNGHILKADTKTDGKFMIDVRYIHLTLIDSQPDAMHDPEIKVGNESINGGMIYGLRGNNSGLNECMRVYSSATFTMKGGSIVSGYADKTYIPGYGYRDIDVSGSVYVTGTFNMTGGRIIDCSTGTSGGGVLVAGGEFNMSGGSIENCHADGNGGGVYVEGGTFNMTGGTIKNCTAGGSGAGVYVADGATATLIPENITGNKKSDGTADDIAGPGGYTVYEPDTEIPDYPLISILPALAKDLPFTDVTSTDWFYSDVKYAYETGLMTGTASDAFSPEAPVTRGMVMTILARREGIRTDRYTPWYAAGCEWAKANGISDGSNPEAPVTREQLAAMLYRYAALKGRDLTAGENLNFTDASDVSAYALPALQWATGEKILTGSNGALNPQAPATRAHLAAILHRYFG